MARASREPKVVDETESTTPEVVRQPPEPVVEKIKIGIEQVIAASPSAAQAYMDGWTEQAPAVDTPSAATTATGTIVEDSDSGLTPTVAGSIGLGELLAERKADATVPEVVVPRTSPMPTIPQYHAHAALSALNNAANGNPSGDEEAHDARLERGKVKANAAAGVDAKNERKAREKAEAKANAKDDEG